jgi:endonuclease/exonuclease/phosphatase family metal-dependent hydrolase
VTERGRPLERGRPGGRTAGVPPAILIALLLMTSACQSARTAQHNFLAKPSGKTIRIMTWNIGRDSMFAGTPDARPEQFARIIRAINPDIVCLQDVFSVGERAGKLFDTILPTDDARAWQHYGVIDNLILTRFDLSRQDACTLEPLARTPAHAMAMVRAPSGQSAYVICGHFQSGTGVAQREQQADLIGEQLYALQSPGALPRRTPIVILGDLNSNASSSSLFVANLREGRIAGNPPRSGRSPDWDGSALEDAVPHHNGRGEETWTWKNEPSEFASSTMDRVIYTGSVAVVEHSFVLNTTSMTPEELSGSALQRDDVMLRPSQNFHDHLPWWWIYASWTNAAVGMCHAERPERQTRVSALRGGRSNSKTPRSNKGIPRLRFRTLTRSSLRSG